MARTRISSRMEKFSYQNSHTVPATGDFFTSWQLDQGEVEAQVKRIMLSFSSDSTKLVAYQLGLFQFTPDLAAFNEDEAIVLSGVIGEQYAHNETITMRVPKDWWVGVKIHNWAANPSNVALSLQMNYKVLN